MGTSTPKLALYKPAAGEDGWSASVNANADKLDEVAAYVQCRHPHRPAGAFFESIPGRVGWIATTAVMASGTLYLTATTLLAGDVITNITFISGGNATPTPTHWYFALYDSAASPALLAQTADQTSTAWSTSTAKTLALTSPYTVLTTGAYYVGIMMTSSGSMNNLLGASMSGGTALVHGLGAGPIWPGTWTSSTGLSTGVAPNPAAALSTMLTGVAYTYGT